MNCNVVHGHERDGYLAFDEVAHRYTLGNRELKSVTTVIQEAFPEFDAPYWAKLKAPKLGITPEELMARWDRHAAEARRLGTQMHSTIEHYYLGDREPEAGIDTFHLFRDFARRYSLNPYRIEWRVYHEEYGVAGTLDFLDCTDGRFTIWDWKRSNKLVDPATGQPRRPGMYTGTAELEGLRHVPDMSFYHYALQLSIYRIILEEKYGIKVDDMRLGIFHPDNPRFYVMPVPFMQREARILLTNH